jgi:phosphinothricin acetyltransferase
MEIRLAKKTDLEKIVEIYNQAVPTNRATADLEKISVDDRLKWFEDHKSDEYPIYVSVVDNKVVGWCSISAYRPGRMALRQTAEISYYIDYDYHGEGIGTALVANAINDCKRIGIRNLIALILEWNDGSIKLLEKFAFERWGLLPKAANFYGKECGHCIMGKRIW